MYMNKGRRWRGRCSRGEFISGTGMMTRIRMRAGTDMTGRDGGEDDRSRRIHIVLGRTRCENEEE